jgi:alkylation response protein AidB-like acyl-CoA dehydrogenase
MSVIEAINTKSAERRSVAELARDLGVIFEQRAMETSDEDKFVADNFALLKAAGLIEAGVPAELGGGGAGIDELAAMLRTIGYHCGSPRWLFPCIPIRSPFRPGDGPTKRRPQSSRC